MKVLRLWACSSVNEVAITRSRCVTEANSMLLRGVEVT